MTTATKQRQQAVKAAKNGEWQTALKLNSAILEDNPEDVSALNRLGVAYLQLNKTGQAKKTFEQVLEIDTGNAIAQRQLERLKNNHVAHAPAFSRQNFIEEPGKTKTAELYRLAGRDVLDTLSVGQPCTLKPKKRYISVEVADQYIGALPEDLSYRLTKLMQSGNTYSCTVRSCSGTHCAVYLREQSRSAANKDTHSFPPSKAAITPVNDVNEEVLLAEKEIPVQIVDHDSDDDSKTMDDVDTSELED